VVWGGDPPSAKPAGRNASASSFFQEIVERFLRRVEVRLGHGNAGRRWRAGRGGRAGVAPRVTARGLARKPAACRPGRRRPRTAGTSAILETPAGYRSSIPTASNLTSPSPGTSCATSGRSAVTTVAIFG